MAGCESQVHIASCTVKCLVAGVAWTFTTRSMDSEVSLLCVYVVQGISGAVYFWADILAVHGGVREQKLDRVYFPGYEI